MSRSVGHSYNFLATFHEFSICVPKSGLRPGLPAEIVSVIVNHDICMYACMYVCMYIRAGHPCVCMCRNQRVQHICVYVHTSILFEGYQCE